MNAPILSLALLGVLALPASAAAPDPEKARAFFECRAAWDGAAAPLAETDRWTADGQTFVNYRLPKRLTLFGVKATDAYVTLDKDGERVRTSVLPGRPADIASRIARTLEVPPANIEHTDEILFERWKFRRDGQPLIQVQVQLTNTGEAPASVVFCIDQP